MCTVCADFEAILSSCYFIADFTNKVKHIYKEMKNYRFFFKTRRQFESGLHIPAQPEFL